MDYSVSSVTAGIDALATTKVVIAPTSSAYSAKLTAQGRTYDRTFSGQGADDDIVVASTRAYVTALNKAIVYLQTQQNALDSEVSVDLDVEEAQKVA